MIIVASLTLPDAFDWLLFEREDIDRREYGPDRTLGGGRTGPRWEDVGGVVWLRDVDADVSEVADVDAADCDIINRAGWGRLCDSMDSGKLFSESIS